MDTWFKKMPGPADTVCGFVESPLATNTFTNPSDALSGCPIKEESALMYGFSKRYRERRLS